MIELPENVKAGTLIPVQIAPFGYFEKDGRNEILDLESMNTLVESFRASGREILVDRDHGSLDEDGSSEAMAWIKDLRIDLDKGLIADFEFTDRGAEAVANRRYRFVSPAWTLDKNGRPSELVSVGLTNVPNLPVKPVLNRSTPQQTQKDNPMNKRLTDLLGLPEDSTEDAIFEAVSALATKCSDLESAAKDKEAEEFVAANEDVVEDPEKLKEQYKKDEEVTKAVVANFRRSRSVVINSTRQPVVKNCANIGQELSKLPPKERAAYFNTHKGE